MKRILVTGSEGFLGKKLVKELRKYYDVWGCDIKESGESSDRWIFCDILSKDDLELVFDYVKPTVCYHLAAIADVNIARSMPYYTLRVNAFSLVDLIQMCAKYNCKLNFISSCCVYGNTNEHPTTEKANRMPTEIYGASKKIAEDIIYTLARLYNVKYNILRPSTIYGPGMRPALAIYIFIERALKNEPLPIHGTGRQTRTWIYIDDLVDALVRVERYGLQYETLNLAGAKTYSVIEVAKKVIQLTDSKSELKFVEDRPGQVMHEEICIDKARKVLQWEPKTSLREGLVKTIEWLRKKLEEESKQ